MNVPGPLTQLGRYQLTRVLGSGAMGVVYEAQDPRLGRKVAIKTILKSHLLDESVGREYSTRFVREAQAAARLNHANIVTVFDFGEEEEVAYIVMEFIEGRELAQHFENQQFFDRPTAMRMMCELLDALAYAHERGIVHRDIKPANVMIDRQGHVKLTDFGVARLAESNADRTVPGTMVGTPSYMSPEQILGQAVGSRADLFAAGVILYQFLTHQRPFAGNGPWVVQRKIITEEAPPPTSVNPGLPPVFDSIVQRALAKDPDQRYQSATEFAADLQRTMAPQAYVDPEATVIRQPTRSGSATGTLPLPGTPPAAGRTHSPAGPTPGTRPPTAPLPPLPMPSLRGPPAAAPGAAGAPAPTAKGYKPMPARPMPRPPSSTPRWPWIAGLVGLGAATAAVWLWKPAPAPAPRPGSPAAPTAPAPAKSGTGLTPGMVPGHAQGQALGTAPAGAGPVAAEPTMVPVSTLPLPGPSAPSPTPMSVRPAGSVLPPQGSAVPGPARADSRTAAARTTGGRCADLLHRLQLGEDLSPENLAVFQKECKR
jgi:serine/threonine protein kinase